MIEMFDAAAIQAAEQVNGDDVVSGRLMDRAATALAVEIAELLAVVRGGV